MFFYCYNVQTFMPDTLYLYGRKIETENIKNLKEIENCKSKHLKITVDSVKSPILAVVKENNVEKLKTSLREFFGIMDFMEEDHLKNIFYKNLDKDIHVIRFSPKNLGKIDNFTSPFCAKIFYEFTNPLETALISKKIKTPCVLQLKTNKTFIKLTDIESVIKTNMPKINVACFDIKLQNFDVVSYSICINGCKYFSGAVKGHHNINTQGKCPMEVHTNISMLYSRIDTILLSEEIDVVVFFNSIGNLRKLLNRHIICDLYQYATANIKCREFSLDELCKYFSVEADNLQNSLCLSKALYDVFIASDVLILSKELSELSGYTLNKVLNNNRAEIIEYALFHDLYDKKYVLPPEKNVVPEKYTGGLVFEPNKECYENLVLLLDFNSLYPSIIQEYNVCFSNPDFNSKEKGVLPKILSNLVTRRKEVKKLMLENKDNRIFNIRQLALKILANSIYGSLGYPKSRFCNYKMAAFITEKGREILSDTKKTIEDNLRYKVIYGDTDSIMINTELQYSPENILKAKDIAKKVIEMINSKFENIEIDLEKIFIRLFMYAKKKYVGKYLDLKNNIKEEYKGIDVVKRNFCAATIDILNKVLFILLDTENNSKHDLYKMLEIEYKNLSLRDNKDFIINNVLSKPPSQYPSNTPLPFVHLCNRLKDRGIVYKGGDVVSFIIGKSTKDEPFYKRAFLPSESFKLDMDYYITHQILPPLIRILSVSRYTNFERIYQIFNIKSGKAQLLKSLQFKLECCGKLQDPVKSCRNCNKPVTEEFYLKAVKNMIGIEINALYSESFQCTDCKAKYFGTFYKCLFCTQELEFIARNYDFDKFLDDLLAKFTNLGFTQVEKLIRMHLDSSEFREFDISPYFKNEIIRSESIE